MRSAVLRPRGFLVSGIEREFLAVAHDANASSRTGSAGTLVGSGTGDGGAGGGDTSGVVDAAGGGMGRVTGGVFFPHASVVSTKIRARGARRLIVDSPVTSTSPAARCC